MEKPIFELFLDILSFIASVCALITIHENSKLRKRINELERENKELKGEKI